EEGEVGRQLRRRRGRRLRRGGFFGRGRGGRGGGEQTERQDDEQDDLLEGLHRDTSWVAPAPSWNRRTSTRCDRGSARSPRRSISAGYASGDQKLQVYDRCAMLGPPSSRGTDVALHQVGMVCRQLREKSPAVGFVESGLADGPQLGGTP